MNAYGEKPTNRHTKSILMWKPPPHISGLHLLLSLFAFPFLFVEVNQVVLAEK
jgi:hypothetical protein